MFANMSDDYIIIYLLNQLNQCCKSYRIISNVCTFLLYLVSLNESKLLTMIIILLVLNGTVTNVTFSHMFADL